MLWSQHTCETPASSLEYIMIFFIEVTAELHKKTSILTPLIMCSIFRKLTFLFGVE